MLAQLWKLRLPLLAFALSFQLLENHYLANRPPEFAAAGVSVALAADALRHAGPATVTAHRGVHGRAPENTAAAIRETIAAGAQGAEVDVQLSKDGVLVVTHDGDFSRMAGVAKKVWDPTYAEIRAIPLGAKAAPESRNEPAPTFDEVLTLDPTHRAHV
jgi:glycerophosphoryl diester phosphodiesterase